MYDLECCACAIWNELEAGLTPTGLRDPALLRDQREGMLNCMDILPLPYVTFTESTTMASYYLQVSMHSAPISSCYKKRITAMQHIPVSVLPICPSYFGKQIK